MIDVDNYELIPAEDDNFPLRLRIYKKAANFRLHWHGHTELLYFIKGGVSIYCSGEEYFVKDGEMIAVNPNELHHGDTGECGVEYFCAMLPPRFFDWVGGEKRYLLRNYIPRDEKIKELMYGLYGAYETESECRRYKTIAHAYELMAYLFENYTSKSLDVSGYTARNSRLENFNNVFDYIEKNYAQQLTTAKMANMVHISEYYFCHLFKEHMGMTFLAYLNDVRIHKAAQLLKNTTLSITRIAAETGYNDVNYFCRIFRKKMNRSPGNYRKG